jgi:hypothetical protein
MNTEGKISASWKNNSSPTRLSSSINSSVDGRSINDFSIALCAKIADIEGAARKQMTRKGYK